MRHFGRMSQYVCHILNLRLSLSNFFYVWNCQLLWLTGEIIWLGRSAALFTNNSYFESFTFKTLLFFEAIVFFPFCAVVYFSNLEDWAKMAYLKNYDWNALFWVWGFLTGPCLNSTFSNKLPIDSWCSISKDVNEFSDYLFKCLLKALMSDFCFGSVPTSQNVMRSSTSPLG